MDHGCTGNCHRYAILGERSFGPGRDPIFGKTIEGIKADDAALAAKRFAERVGNQSKRVSSADAEFQRENTANVIAEFSPRDSLQGVRERVAH